MPRAAAQDGEPQYHRKTCMTGARRKPPDGWHTLGRDEWLRVLRAWRLTPSGKAVALSLAQYANKKDGKSAHPGTERLAWESCTSVITVRRTLHELQNAWLIHCFRCGDGRGNSTDWWLTTYAAATEVGVPFETWKKYNQ